MRRSRTWPPPSSTRKAAVTAAIREAHGAPLTTQSLHRWHRRLMAGPSHLPEHLIGAFRDTPGWIGGTSLLDGALVRSTPDDLIDDLVAFANRDNLDAVTQAGVAQARSR